MAEQIPKYTQGQSRSVAGFCYLQALKVLSGELNVHNDDSDFLLLPMDMLAGFVLELFFKAHLLHNGVPDRDVRRFGHDLDAALSKSKELGLPFVAGLDELVSDIGAGHKDFTFRYVESGGDVPKVSWKKVIPILDALRAEVGRSDPQYTADA